MVDISILIPALNEERNIGRCIDSINANFPKSLSVEVLVGDHGSVDETHIRAQERGAEVVAHRGGTVGALRNVLAARAKGKILIFLDADTSVTPEWGSGMIQVVNELSRNSNQITGSFCAIPQNMNIFTRYWFSKINASTKTYLGTGHLIIAETLFQKLGGFNTDLRSGEDYDLCVRAKILGAHINPRPELVVYHHDYPSSISAFIRREAWHGSGDFMSLSSVIKSKVALATIGFMLLHLALIITIPFSRSSAAAVFLLIIGLTALLSLAKFRDLSPQERMFNIFIFYIYLWGRAFSTLQIWSRSSKAAA